MEILIIVLLILLNGVFAMSEVALISARRSNLATRAKQGNKAAQKALDLAKDPDKFLSTIQIGITLIGILTGLYSGEALAGPFGAVLASWGVPAATAAPAAQIVIVIVVTYLSIVFGELVPKRIGMKGAERVAILVARPMRMLSVLASPFVWLLSKSTSLITKLLHIKATESKVTEEEIKSIIREGTEGGEVQVVEQQIVGRVFSLGDRKVGSIMTHRSDMAWININMTAGEIRELVNREPHSLYPAAEKNLDDISGVVYLKDLFQHIDDEDFDIMPLLQPAKFFHETTEVYSALEQLREEQTGYGIVSDEYGITQGIVTLRDILEALVGTIPEVEEEPEIVRRDDDSCLIDGQCSFYDFLVNFGLEDAHKNNQYNTISGLILDKLGHIPHTGEKVEWHNYTFEIVDMDGVRIDKVLVYETPAKEKSPR